jgi:hypothetical protein
VLISKAVDRQLDEGNWQKYHLESVHPDKTTALASAAEMGLRKMFFWGMSYDKDVESGDDDDDDEDVVDDRVVFRVVELYRMPMDTSQPVWMTVHTIFTETGLASGCIAHMHATKEGAERVAKLPKTQILFYGLPVLLVDM